MTVNEEGNDVLNRTGTVAATIVLGFIGGELLLLLPVIIGAVATDLGLNARQVGFVGAGGMLGMAISAASSVFWVRRVDWRRAATIAMSILVLGQVGCMLGDGFWSFTTAFAISSLGGGATYSLVLTVLSDHRTPDRMFGYLVTAQVAFSVVGFAALPAVAERGGLDAMLGVLCALALIGLALTRLLPRSGRTVTHYSIAREMKRPEVMFALLGCFMFFVNVGMFWTYIERIGNAEGFSGTQIGGALAFGVAISMLGSLSAAWLGESFGRLKALTVGSIGTVIAVALLPTGMGIWLFVLGIAVFNCAWNFSVTYQYAVVAAADASGRSVAIVPAFHALGGSVGPAIAALFVSGESFLAVNVLCAMAALISLILFAFAMRKPTGNSSDNLEHRVTVTKGA